MKNFVQRGVEMDYANSSGSQINSGDVVPLGSGIGVATVDIPDQTTGAIVLEGVVQLAKATSESWAQGDKIFWDNSAKKLTKTPTAYLAGLAFQAQLSADALGNVKLVFLGEKDSSGSFSQAVFVAQVATTNAVDLPTAEALANALKVSHNALLTSLINAGLMASS